MSRSLRVMQISLSLLAALAGGIFALAEGGPIPALTIPIAVAAHLLIDREVLRPLPAWTMNLLAMAAFAIALLEFLFGGIESPLLSGGHLLCYLTWTFLLQKKEDRQIWWIAGLSVLQVAVASLLTYSSWFGPALVLFLLVALWTLALFQVQRAIRLVRLSTHEATAVTASQSVTRQRSSFTAMQQGDEPRRWLTGRFVGHSLFASLLSLLLTIAFFLFVPRVWLTNAPAFISGGRAVGGAPSRTGFTNTVRLGQIGEIQESTRLALDVRLTNANGEPVSWTEWERLMGAIRLRGTVQEVYHDGVWSSRSERSQELRFDGMGFLGPGYFRQHLTVYPVDAEDSRSGVLFASGMPLRVRQHDDDRRVMLRFPEWVVVQSSEIGRTDPFTVVFDVAPRELWFPNEFGVTFQMQRDPRRHQDYLGSASVLSAELKEGLQAWLDAGNGPRLEDPTDYELVTAWDHWFRTDPGFSYSLDMSIDDPTIDPVLDFLTNRRRGHCEYYASALALVLRAHNVPTRIVNGYKGGNINPRNGRLEVRDLHAHAWVEAYITEAPPDEQTGVPGPRWVTLDPTPAARDVAIAEQQAESTGIVDDLRTRWQILWSEGLRMTRDSQKQLVYSPMETAATSTWEAVTDLFERGRLPTNRLLRSPREWFSWQGGLVVFLLLTTLSGIVWSFRKMLSVLRGPGADESRALRNGRVVPFYQRLEELLARRGVRRDAFETPREFAAAASRVPLADGPDPIGNLPRQLTEDFYAVRYGGKSLSEEESRRIEQELDELSAKLSP